MPRLIAALLLVLACAPGPAVAHDASAYGGMFRSRSMGKSWLNADVGLFLSAALAVAVDPRDPDHLLMGTDAGLLASANGGRSWTREAPAQIAGAVFAVAFAPGGGAMLCAATSGIYRFAGGQWLPADAPPAASPARAIVFGSAPGHVYLLGRERLFGSHDGGASFERIPSETADFTTLTLLDHPTETLFAIAEGQLLTSTDAGRHWLLRPVTSAAGPVDTVMPDPAVNGRLWAAAADQLHVSDDLGLTWRTVGNPLPEARTMVRGIAADPAAATLVVTTHRGAYRSADGGAHWVLEEGNLPVHLEAGPLARDPADPGTLYAVYSLIPYPEVWRSALDGSNLLARADRMSLLGGLAFLLLLLLGGGVLVARLVRWRAA